jgi:prepilin-type N-terminal cleavage/methylation domain-containing protein
MRRLKRRGFTLTEILISIAILSIGALGAISALSFGLFSSQQASQQTFAQSYTKKVLELLESNTLPYTQYCANGTYANSNTTIPSSDEAAGSGNWTALDAGPLASTGTVINLWGASGSIDLTRWQNEAPKYESCIFVAPVANSAGTLVPTVVGAAQDDAYLAGLRLVTVLVRWNVRGVWKTLQTQAYIIIKPVGT